MQFDSRKPRRLAPRELLLGRTPGVLSQWERRRHAPEAGATSARDLIAVWAGLRRLAEGPSGESLSSLERVVTDDTVALGAAIASLVFHAAQWCQRVEELDRAWATAEQDEEDLDWQTYTLFEELDRVSLACWWLRKQTEEVTETVDRLSREIEAAEACLAVKVNLFLCLATDAAAVLSDSRPDLDSTEPQLWDTLLKHRRIEEARDQIELSPRCEDLIKAIELHQPRRMSVLAGAAQDRSVGSSSGPTDLKLIYHSLLGPALADYDARVALMGMAAATPQHSQWSRIQAELERREIGVEGDEAVLVRLKLLLPTDRATPMLRVLLEAREAGGEEAISAYEAFEVFVPGMAAPLRTQFDFDVNVVELDDQPLESLRASGGQVAVILVTRDGQRRPIRPRWAP